MSFDCSFWWMPDMIAQTETGSWMIWSEIRPHQVVLFTPSVSLSPPFTRCSPCIDQTSWGCIGEISPIYFPLVTAEKISWFLIC